MQEVWDAGLEVYLLNGAEVPAGVWGAAVDDMHQQSAAAGRRCRLLRCLADTDDRTQVAVAPKQQLRVIGPVAPDNGAPAAPWGRCWASWSTEAMRAPRSRRQEDAGAAEYWNAGRASSNVPAALAVAQKLVAQARPRVRALQQPRDVGPHRGPEVYFHHPQVGHQRGEGVVRDLGARGARLRCRV
jgi:hypothetical protein